MTLLGGFRTLKPPILECFRALKPTLFGGFRALKMLTLFGGFRALFSLHLEYLGCFCSVASSV